MNTTVLYCASWKRCCKQKIEFSSMELLRFKNLVIYDDSFIVNINIIIMFLLYENKN